VVRDTGSRPLPSPVQLGGTPNEQTARDKSQPEVAQASWLAVVFADFQVALKVKVFLESDDCEQ